MMRIFPLMMLSLGLGFLMSCGTTRPSPYGLEQQTVREQEVISQSLFDAKDRTISEEDIQRLLAGEIRLSDSLRIAVYKHAGNSTNRYYQSYWNNEDYIKSQQVFLDTLVNELSSSPKVQKVVIVPSMMVSKNPTITALRETTVRLQADLLLVFSLNSDVYYKYKAFQKNEAKAFATCETIILDTRTGVVPHSSVITREAFVKKVEEDWTQEETRKRAENTAIVAALLESGKRAAAFLSGN